MAEGITIIEKGRERAIEGRTTGLSALDAFATLWRNRSLGMALVQRDINLRYRGSALGIAWLVLSPAVMALAYTYLFGFLLKARFSPGGGIGHTWVGIYLGTALYNVFSEPVVRASSLIQDQASFVKKIAMPLRILPVVPVATALISCGVSLGLLLPIQVALTGMPSAAALALPAFLVPYALAVLGACWIVSACAAYLRDLRQVVGFGTTLMLFVAPVFYPHDLIPEPLRTAALLNPVAFCIVAVRGALLDGSLPPAGLYGAYLAICLASFAGGYAVYRRLQGGFADVV